MKKLIAILMTIVILFIVPVACMATIEAPAGFLDSLTSATGLDLGTLIGVAISLLEAILRLLPTKKNYTVLKLVISIAEKILSGIKAAEEIIPNNIITPTNSTTH